MSQEILVNITPQEVRVAVLENGLLQEIHVERTVKQGILGNIYKGRVSRLLPGIQAAFVDIGLERAAFLHVSDLQACAIEEDTSQLDIRDFIATGDKLLVQAYKDPLASKGARLTTQFTIPSRYLVFTPGLRQVAVSQRIVDEHERERLFSLIESNEEGGYIFRTAAEGVTAEDLENDKLLLNAIWQEISARMKTTKSPGLVYEEIPIVLRVLRDLVGFSVEKIRVDNLAAFQQMYSFAEKFVPKLLDKLEYYQENRSIFEFYPIETEIQKALDRKVYLKSGGYIVFDQTEAMTTVDVNTGSNLGSTNSAQTILLTNLEAAEVIARQVRLRNIGGIVIIDFIDMVEPAHKEKLLTALTAAVAKDSSRVHLSELSSLGLVQMTRKRTRDSLERILCIPCPTCKRKGIIKSLTTVISEIYREIKSLHHHYRWSGFLVIVSERMGQELSENNPLLIELASQLAKPIKLEIDKSFLPHHYDIVPFVEKAGIC